MRKIPALVFICTCLLLLFGQNRTVAAAGSSRTRPEKQNAAVFAPADPVQKKQHAGFLFLSGIQYHHSCCSVPAPSWDGQHPADNTSGHDMPAVITVRTGTQAQLLHPRLMARLLFPVHYFW